MKIKVELNLTKEGHKRLLAMLSYQKSKEPNLTLDALVSRLMTRMV